MFNFGRTRTTQSEKLGETAFAQRPEGSAPGDRWSGFSFGTELVQDEVAQGPQYVTEENFQENDFSAEQSEQIFEFGDGESVRIKFDGQTNIPPVRAAFQSDSITTESSTRYSIAEEAEQASTRSSLLSANVPRAHRGKEKSPPPDVQAAKLKSALGVGTVIEGKFSFDSPTKIDGCLTGEIHSQSTLVVGEHAIVRANIDVGTLLVLGRIEGEVKASELVKIGATGQIQGNVLSPQFAIELGGFYEGTVSKKE